MVEHNNDDVEFIVDRALSSYVPEYEPLGLHQRVLGRIRENARSRQRRKLPLFMFAFASLCIAIVALVVAPGSRSLRSRPATQASVPLVSLGVEHHEREAILPLNEYKRAKVSRATTVRRKPPGASPSSEHNPSLPKLDQFPAPAPLTNEERALLQLPTGSAAYLSVSKHSSIDPIHIEPLRIDPL